MTGDRSTSVTLTEEEEYSDDESYQWSEDSDIESYLSWEEDSVLRTDDDIDSEEEDSDLENLDEDMELAKKTTKKDNRNSH